MLLASKKACPSKPVPLAVWAPGTTVTGSDRTVRMSAASRTTRAPVRPGIIGGQKPEYSQAPSPSARTPGSNWCSSPARAPSDVPSG